jgi:parallel beta-helix repeat protein
MSTAHAATFLVNDDWDPDAGVAADCMGGTPGNQCSLRDAIAAADQAPDLDIIQFSIDETIFINKRLLAQTPVAIDGGSKGVTIRVAQGYTVAILPDAFVNPETGNHDFVSVLQPDYYSVNTFSSPQAMLALLGHGSSVKNVTLDGSITARSSDGQDGVARIDTDSDGETDTLLYTVNNHWLVANGIFTVTANIESNELRYMRQYAINVSSAFAPSIVDNRVHGGAAGTDAVPGDQRTRYKGNGIWVVFAGQAVVAGNHVSGYNTGIELALVSGATVKNNRAAGNATGITIDAADDSVALNLVDDNDASGNLAIGITVNQVAPESGTDTVLSLTNNRVKSNDNVGIRISNAAYVSVVGNDVQGNGAGGMNDGGIEVGAFAVNVSDNTVKNNRGFGVVIGGPMNAVRDNRVTNNLGGGIILFEGYAQGNQIESNVSESNDYGVLSVSFTGHSPSQNYIANNRLRKNKTADAADNSLTCVNYWVGNTFETVDSASEGCIH